MKIVLILFQKVSLIILFVFIFGFLFSCQNEDISVVQENIDELIPESGEQALEWLLEGNKRFVTGNSQHRREGTEWREKLTEGQQPFATILGCSDSRVPIELLFDQGFGDLFIIRVAGNVLGPDEKGSIAYAVDHLHTPLILVLGHEGCGAVTAAMLPDSERQKEAPFLQTLLETIDPAVKDINPGLPHKQRIHEGVEANVRQSVQQLITELGKYEEYDNILVSGAVYELDTGLVKIIE
jgi:carbonic anhydrase